MGRRPTGAQPTEASANRPFTKKARTRVARTAPPVNQSVRPSSGARMAPPPGTLSSRPEKAG